MVKIISIQRFAGRGVVQFVRDKSAGALQFDATLTDDAVRKLVAAGDGTGKDGRHARYRHR